MFKRLLFLLATIFAFGIPKTEPKQLISNIRIAGGDYAKIEEYPYQLSLLYGLMHACGAVIVDANWAVTSASCTDREIQDFQIQYSSPWLGNGHIVIVKEVHQHPKYNSTSLDFDISVLELAEPLKLSETAKPINLVPSGSEPSEGSLGTVTGWGLTGRNDNIYSKLLKVLTLPTISKESCNEIYEGKISENMICTGLKASGDGFCEGDNGGPLVVDGKLAGIASWKKGCNDTVYPGVYSNIGTLGDFIREVTGLDL